MVKVQVPAEAESLLIQRKPSGLRLKSEWAGHVPIFSSDQILLIANVLFYLSRGRSYLKEAVVWP